MLYAAFNNRFKPNAHTYTHTPRHRQHSGRVCAAVHSNQTIRDSIAIVSWATYVHNFALEMAVAGLKGKKTVCCLAAFARGSAESARAPYTEHRSQFSMQLYGVANIHHLQNGPTTHSISTALATAHKKGAARRTAVPEHTVKCTADKKKTAHRKQRAERA